MDRKIRNRGSGDGGPKRALLDLSLKLFPSLDWLLMRGYLFHSFNGFYSSLMLLPPPRHFSSIRAYILVTPSEEKELFIIAREKPDKFTHTQTRTHFSGVICNIYFLHAIIAKYLSVFVGNFYIQTLLVHELCELYMWMCGCGCGCVCFSLFTSLVLSPQPICLSFCIWYTRAIRQGQICMDFYSLLALCFFVFVSHSSEFICLLRFYPENFAFLSLSVSWCNLCVNCTLTSGWMSFFTCLISHSCLLE